jgi:hypothetical protein
VRYWAIRGESLEPGGCSVTPTSPRTALRTAWPARVPEVGIASAAAPGPVEACVSVAAKAGLAVVAPGPAGAVGAQLEHARARHAAEAEAVEQRRAVFGLLTAILSGPRGGGR